jgi:tetratricopeptide (TPR) repeat protein
MADLAPAAGEDPAPNATNVDAIRALIEQLGSDDFKKREEAEERLVEMGATAIEALRTAAKSDEFEIAFRSKRALKRITELSPAEQAELRKVGQAAFYEGDYAAMVRCYRRLASVENGTIDDGRWLGHAYQLSNQWKDAANAYSAVLDRMDQLLDGGAAAEVVGGDDWTPASPNAIQKRAATILLTARIQRHLLKDTAAAEKTLRRINRSNGVLTESLDVMAEKWRTRIAAALEAKKDIAAADRDVGISVSLRYPMMALRELAAVQQVNGNHKDALETWRRIHFTTSEYVGFTPSIESAAIDQLIQNLPAESLASVPAVTILDPEHPMAQFDLGDVATLVKSYDLGQNYWYFALAAEKEQEFESLEFTCDIEQMEAQYGGQFDCWSMVGEQGDKRKGIGYMHWPSGKPVGRDKITQKHQIEPGTGLVHFSAGTWKDKFKVHGVKVAATFRPRSKDVAAVKPIPGFTFNTEFLPKGGSITINGRPYGNETTSHNVKPERSLLEYSHPKLKEPRKFDVDFQPGANYSLFLNLDSPFTGELTNLRGFHSHYGPCTNVVKMPNGRWLVAWCDSGLRFASSDDLVTWSKPTVMPDSELFKDDYNCLSPMLYVDQGGAIWVAYYSNQLDIDQINTGGYRLFLRSSKDGREWSPPRPVKMTLSGWPPGNLQMLSGPDNKTWVLYRLQCAVTDSPAEIGEFKDLEIPVTNDQRSHARNPHATVDAAGRVHLVWDHFGQTLYYSRRDKDGHWSEPLDIAEKGPNQRASHPQLIIRGDQLALIYTVNQSAFLRRGKLTAGAPTFGEPLKIAPHTAQLLSSAPLFTADDKVVFLTGQDTMWKQTGSLQAVLGE